MKDIVTYFYFVMFYILIFLILLYKRNHSVVNRINAPKTAKK